MSTPTVDLEIGGMTCASCAMRVEKKLNRLDGVRASVNYATESAHVVYPEDLSIDDLVRTVEATGYTATVPPLAPASEPAESDEARDAHRGARRRLLVSALLSAPVVALAMIPAWQFRGWQWVALALATPVVTWGAWPFHRAAAVNARHGAATMDTLISLGAIVSYAWSVFALTAGGAGELGMRMDMSWIARRGDGSGHLYLEVGAALTTFLLFGRYVEARAKHRAGSALRALLSLGAKDVAVLRRGVEVRVPVAELRVGDRFAVRPGETVATDGVVVEGASAVDVSMLTGESVPVEVGPGDAVTGATTNAGGRLIVRATRVGRDTQLARMARLVRDAQTGKAPVQRLADRISGVFVPIVIGLAALTFVAWLLAGGGTSAAITAAVAVLIVACPCALGLATPVALLVGTGRAASMGIVIRGPQILESTRRIDTIVLDKTGTVTTGTMSVIAVTPDSDRLRTYAASVEAAAEHPIARAIATLATPLPVTDFQITPGLGARGVVDGHEVYVGRPTTDVTASREARSEPPRTSEGSVFVFGTAVEVSWDGKVEGTITVADAVRPTSAAAITRFKRLGLHPVLLTGDAKPVAEAVAGEVGIDEVHAEVMPADKLALVKQLQADGKVVAMVGDGVNDAAALAAADLGIAMGSGTDVAIQAADITLMRTDLAGVADSIELSRATLRVIQGNLFWAFAYNVAALPLAAFGLVTPVLAAAAMAASSLFVVGNSLRLLRTVRRPSAS